MKTIYITCEWRSHHSVEVPDDFPEETPRYLDGFPDEVLEEMTSNGAELVDWEVHGKR